ncbi:ATP-binding protein [Nocardia violaceofusca]|uniref:ATP-binding protein n=1 Tax=Nocardia violaceofusca TaxID=941182 RepID=UPI0007A42E95|nr:ATP-binding protein [Nocardia violaceofusca]
MTSRTETLSELLVAYIETAKAGHCLRVDDLTSEQAVDLQAVVAERFADRPGRPPLMVRVLDQNGGRGRVTIEEAVGLRNDIAHSDEHGAILILLVPPSLAREASSLDNAFLRLPYTNLLEAAADHVIDRIRAARPDFPVNELSRLTRGRTPIEYWLEFLEYVERDPRAPFGDHLWRIGLIPDGGDDDATKARLRDNAAFVRKVADPAGAGHAIDDRLRQTRLAPGDQFNRLLAELTAREDHLHDARKWTEAIADRLGVKFDQFKLVDNEIDSDLDHVEVLPFRSTAGTVAKSTGLMLDGESLVCQIRGDSPGKVVVKWRTTPVNTKRVHKWYLRLVHPEDLREDGEAPLVEKRVAGTKRTATLKLDLASEDITGGFLFVVEVLPLDDDDLPLTLPESALTESEPFDLIFLDDTESPEVTRPPATAHSLGAARLRAVANGANSLTETNPVWEWNRHLFSLRIDGSRSVQVPANAVTVSLQKQILTDPGIVGYVATSPYGLALQAEDFKPLYAELPAAFAKKRRQVMELLAADSRRDVPEVFAWDGDSRAVIQDYLQSYKRALDSAEGSTLEILQRLDTVDVALGSATSGASDVTVVLPLQPLRLAWLAAYDQLTRTWGEEILQRGVAAGERKTLIDFEGLTRIAPTNIPFAVATAERTLNVYFDELTFGVGVLLPLGHPAPDVLAATVSTVFGLVRQSASMSSDSAMIADRFIEYRKAHRDPKALRLAAMHPGDGAVLAEALAAFGTRTADDSLRLEVVAYGERDRYAEPLAPLTRLQIERDGQQIQIGPPEHPGDSPAAGARHAKQSPLFAPIEASLRPLDRIVSDFESIHVALASGISDLKKTLTPRAALGRFTSLEDLLCPLVTTDMSENDGGWTVSPALHPRTKTDNATIVTGHRSHQTAAGTALGLAGPPALRVEVTGDTLDYVRVLHERSDWVLTLDRFVGLNFYERGPFRQGATNYILDYAPDFIDGMSHRLTVTTAHRAEMTSILKHAMTDLGLDALEASSTQVLDDLMTISGRLLLRLQSSEGFARESVSLAALVSHLRGQKKLDGAIIVPVDSHQEIFGRTALGNESGRRCDMLIVRVTQRRLNIECIEVKSRRYAVLPNDLADSIADQLETTRDLLVQRFFASDPPRIDAALQRAQLAGLLHYYADRAVTNGLLTADKVAETHKHIDSLVEGGLEVEITMHGYVISLTGSEGLPARHRGIPISVLTAADLGKLGFSILPTEASTAATSSDNSSVLTGDVEQQASTPSTQTSTLPEPEDSDTTGSDKNDEILTHPSEVEPTATPAAVAPAGPSRSDQSSDAASDSHRLTAEPLGAVAERVGVRDVRVSVGTDATGVQVVWEPSTKGSPHAFIVGIPGQGKSVTTRRLVRELARHGLPSLVIDFHGDMAADPPANAEVLQAENGLPFTPFDVLNSGESAKVNQASWELAEVIQFVGSMGEIQRSNVYKALQEAYNTAIAEHRVPTLSEFATALEDVERRTRGAQNARERVRPLTDFGLFDENASRGFAPREVGMVVDLSKLMLEEVQIAATSFLLRRVYRDMFSWSQDGTLKLAIVLDEAHRVANDVTLPKLMKEGRKYGVVVLVASQGLSDFHRDVLGNAGTKIVFRTNHPESKAVARYLRGRAGQDLSVEVEKLGVGQAYVATTEVPQARKTTMFE